MLTTSINETGITLAMCTEIKKVEVQYNHVSMPHDDDDDDVTLDEVLCTLRDNDENSLTPTCGRAPHKCRP